MKNMLKKIFGYGLLFISMSLIAFMLGDRLSNDINIPYKGIVILLCAVAIFAIAGTAILASILSKKELKVNMMNTILWVILLAYIVALLKVLFIDRTDLSASSFIYHKEMRHTNLVPFATIKLFIRSWNYGYLNKGLIVSNLIGNILIFVPMVILLWCIFNPMRKKYIVIVVNFIIIVAVELGQYFTGYGSSDIDDIILNMIGVIFSYMLVNTKLFKTICKKLYIINDI